MDYLFSQSHLLSPLSVIRFLSKHCQKLKNVFLYNLTFNLIERQPVIWSETELVLWEQKKSNLKERRLVTLVQHCFKPPVSGDARVIAGLHTHSTGQEQTLDDFDQ